MEIKLKLIFGFLTIALLVGVIGLFGISNNEKNKINFQETKLIASATFNLEKIKSTLSTTLLEMTTFVLLEYPDKKAENKQVTIISKNKDEFIKAIEEYKNIVKNTEHELLSNDIERFGLKIVPLIGKVVELKMKEALK